jgi:hypothetical protein
MTSCHPLVDLLKKNLSPEDISTRSPGDRSCTVDISPENSTLASIPLQVQALLYGNVWIAYVPNRRK